jgi:4-aminobutyrate aminotransferase-like enzyme
MGAYLSKELKSMAEDYDCVQNPRGLGLMQAIDIMPVGLDRIVPLRDSILDRCFDEKLILLGCGKYGIRFCPALTVSEEEIRSCIETLRTVIEKLLKSSEKSGH